MRQLAAGNVHRQPPPRGKSDYIAGLLSSQLQDVPGSRRLFDRFANRPSLTAPGFPCRVFRVPLYCFFCFPHVFLAAVHVTLRPQDSLYKPIERAPRKFNSLPVPKKLQAALPFASKPKLAPKRKKKGYLSKR